MSYQSQADATRDPGFSGRVQACATEQALVFVNDARPEFNVLAARIIGSNATALALVPLVAGQPGITTESADADLLAAVQAVWPVYGATLTTTTSEGTS